MISSCKLRPFKRLFRTHHFPIFCFPFFCLSTMASDELNKPSVPAAPSLPQYPELILAAIEAVNDENGVNKSTISKHIEASYGTLPGAHSTLLSHHLNRMKASGQIVMLKNNYLKPDPNAPPRRGRGRPPKPKDPLASGAVVSPPRPRGRPPKPRDPLAPVSSPTKTPPSSGRKRGRPPKIAKTTPAEAPIRVAPTTSTGAPRGRGRPPKVKASVVIR